MKCSVRVFLQAVVKLFFFSSFFPVAKCDLDPPNANLAQATSNWDGVSKFRSRTKIE